MKRRFPWLSKLVCGTTLFGMMTGSLPSYAQVPSTDEAFQVKLLKGAHTERFHITTDDKDARLEMVDRKLFRKSQDLDDDDVWVTACPLPCDQTLDVTKTYRINGKGMPDSKPFQLHRDHPHLHVLGGSTAQKVVGITLIPVGGTISLFGLWMWSMSKYNVENPHRSDSNVEILAIFGGTGLVLSLLGIALIVHSKPSISERKSKRSSRWQAPPSMLSVGSGMWLSPQGLHFLTG
jgi:hypothetical protein